MKNINILCILIIISNVIIAQNHTKCLTNEIVNKLDKEEPFYLNNRYNINLANKEWILNSNSEKQTINIPIVVHVIHRSTHSTVGFGTNISNNQIADAIRILNEDYSKTNPEFPNPPRSYFKNNAGNPNLKFCLATVDPNGQPTSGVTRTATSKQNFNPSSESNDMKRSQDGGKDGWDPDKYLNIWVCDLAGSASSGLILGYAYLPGLPSWLKWRDGLVIDFQWFGTIDGAAPSSDGRTATHEIGHYLGLNHTFCESQNGGCCDNDDDNVNDTPASYYNNNGEDGPYYGSVNANTNNNTCNDLFYQNIFNSNVIDMDENFMAYSRDTWMFTNDQANVMAATLNNYRLSLKNSNVSIDCSGNSPTSVSLNKIDKIEIFPNPSSGKINIKTENKIQSIDIFNLVGECVYSNYNIDNNIFDISKNPNGVYFLNILTNQKNYTKKIILLK